MKHHAQQRHRLPAKVRTQGGVHRRPDERAILYERGRLLPWPAWRAGRSARSVRSYRGMHLRQLPLAHLLHVYGPQERNRQQLPTLQLKSIAIAPHVGISFDVRLFHESLIVHQRNPRFSPLFQTILQLVPDQHVKRYMCRQRSVAALRKARRDADRIPLPANPLEATVNQQRLEQNCIIRFGKERRDQIQRANPVQNGGWEMRQFDQVIHLHGEPTTFRLHI